MKQMDSIISEMARFLGARQETISTLKEIKKEIDTVGKNVKTTSMVTKVVSVGAGITSIALIVATPFTAGASAPVAAGVAALGATSAAVSGGASIVKHVKESDLMKSATEVIKKDQRARERLQAAVKTLKSLASLSKDTIKFLEKAAEIGMTTTKEIDAVLKLAGTAKATEIVAKAAGILEKVNKVTRIVGPVLLVISIPLDIISIIVDMLDSGKVSEASKQVEKNIDDLKDEYDNVKKTYEEIRKIF